MGDGIVFTAMAATLLAILAGIVAPIVLAFRRRSLRALPLSAWTPECVLFFGWYSARKLTDGAVHLFPQWVYVSIAIFFAVIGAFVALSFATTPRRPNATELAIVVLALWSVAGLAGIGRLPIVVDTLAVAIVAAALTLAFMQIRSLFAQPDTTSPV
jgi:hypothetical protein